MDAAAKRRSPVTIELHDSAPSRLWPECVRALQSLPAGISCFAEWNYRHPFGMYNVSVGNLPRRFSAVLDALDLFSESFPRATPPEVSDIKRQILDMHERLLYAMLEHLEDCYHIACSFFPKASFNKEPALREYQTAIRPYRDRFGAIVNAVKHSQARLGFFEATNRLIRIPGYNVQGSVQAGVVGPLPEIHGQTGQGQISAISFNYDVRLLFCTIFVAARNLTRLAERIVSERKQASGPAAGASAAPHTTTVAEVAECPWSFATADRIAKLPSFVFPGEIKRPVPIVEAFAAVAQSPDGVPGRLIRVTLSDRRTPLTLHQLPGGQFKLTVEFQGDGVTRSFKVI